MNETMLSTLKGIGCMIAIICLVIVTILVIICISYMFSIEFNQKRKQKQIDNKNTKLESKNFKQGIRIAELENENSYYRQQNRELMSEYNENKYRLRIANKRNELYKIQIDSSYELFSNMLELDDINEMKEYIARLVEIYKPDNSEDKEVE